MILTSIIAAHITIPRIVARILAARHASRTIDVSAGGIRRSTARRVIVVGAGIVKRIIGIIAVIAVGAIQICWSKAGYTGGTSLIAELIGTRRCRCGFWGARGRSTVTAVVGGAGIQTIRRVSWEIAIDTASGAKCVAITEAFFASTSASLIKIAGLE